MTTDTDVVEDTKITLKRPKKWKVIVHNDDVTPMNFVVELLYYVFKLNVQEATELMLKIHTEGRGVAGIYTYETAEQKYGEANVLIKLSAMPLQITMEEES